MAPKVKSGGIKKTTKFKKVTQKRLSSKAPLSSGETSTTPPQDANPNSAIYFWRPHTPNGYLSQWYESPFEHDGCTYETAEKWMMVGKARLFGDTEIAQRMLETTDPKEHKRLGRLVKNFDDRVWNTERMRIVEEGTWWKFTESNDKEELKRLLLETGERELVEASPMDRIWGIGFGERNAGNNRHRWGKNLLGKALMNVRERLKKEEEEEEEEKIEEE